MDESQWVGALAGPVLGALLALLCLGFALRAGKRLRLVENLPTSKTTGVFIGLVELKGTAEAENPLTAWLSGQRCVYFEWTVREHWSRTVTERYTDNKGCSRTRTRQESGWKTVAEGGDSIPFYLKDDCGVLLIRPEKADIESADVFQQTVGIGDPLYYGKGPADSIAYSDHRRQFVEKAIALHAPLYILGHARERQDVVAAEIAYDSSAEMFLISARSEQKVSSCLRWGFWGLALLGLVGAVGGCVVRSYMQQRQPEMDLGLWIAVGGGYLGVWFMGTTWMIYNSIVALRARVRQAWANIDVQLKRRNDLIPNLVAITRGFRDFEQKLQVELAQLRRQLTATAPGKPGPDSQACANCLVAIAEKYPELKANTTFLALQCNLIDTENRISLARGYFNDIATFYNTRLEVIPDRFIAALSLMQPATLMTANEFAHQPIHVELADT